MKRTRQMTRSSQATPTPAATSSRADNSNDRLNQSRGESIPSNVRAAIEPRFGHDFANVRIHADAAADTMAQEFGARAMTVDHDVYFRDGAFEPGDLDSTHLLAHELAHVAQHDNAGGAREGVSTGSDASERAARSAADAAVSGAPVHVGSAAPAAVSLEEEGEKKESESIFGTIGEMLKAPKDIGNVFGGLEGPSSIFGALGGFDKAMNADNGIDAASGLASTGSGILGLAKTFGEDTLGEAKGTLGGIGGLLGAGSSTLNAISDFSKGNYGKGALDTTKAAGGAASGLAEFGGFELGEVADMGAGEALFGGGGEGLAALGPLGAVAGAGLAGAGIGTLLYDHTSVKEHSQESLGGLDAFLTGDNKVPWSQRTSDAASNDWDKGDYLGAVGNGAELAGFATLGALGGIGGGVVDAGKWAGSHIADAAGAVGGGIADAAGAVGGGIADAAGAVWDWL